MNNAPLLYASTSGAPELPAIIFLHGGGLSARMWQPVIQRLPEFYCLAPDLPEHGQSRGLAPFDLSDSARRVADLIRARVPAGQAHLVGLSLGGAVALTTALQDPGVVSRMLVSGTSATLSRFLGSLSLGSLWMLRLYQPQTLARSSAKQWGIPEEYLPLFEEDILHSVSVDFNRRLIENLMRQQLPTSIPNPMLVTVGEKETIPAKQAARKLAGLYPQAEGRVVPGLGHVWALQDPNLFAATVRAWVTGAPLPPALRPLT
jgi:pimeloyl-ACP methyl ester carboxylesterase